METQAKGWAWEGAGSCLSEGFTGEGEVRYGIIRDLSVVDRPKHITRCKE